MYQPKSLNSTKVNISNKTIKYLAVLVNGISGNKQALTYKMVFAIWHTSDAKF